MIMLAEIITKDFSVSIERRFPNFHNHDHGPFFYGWNVYLSEVRNSWAHGVSPTVEDAKSAIAAQLERFRYSLDGLPWICTLCKQPLSYEKETDPDA